MGCYIFDERIPVNIIRDGKEMEVSFCELKAKDLALLPTGIKLCIGSDAHISGDSTYEGWLVYDDQGNGYFPEDFKSEVQKESENPLDRCMSALLGQLPKCPEQAHHGFWTDGSVIFCQGDSAAEAADAVAKLLEDLGVKSATAGLCEPSESVSAGCRYCVGMEY